MKVNIFGKRKTLALAVSLASTSGMSSAQVMDEIIVTAGKREQSAQDIPYNISVMTGDRMESLGIKDSNALLRAIPGLTSFDEGPRVGGSRNNLHMRGLNVNTASNEDDNPMISQFKDDQFTFDIVNTVD